MLPVLLATLAATVPTVDCPRHIETDPSSAQSRRATLRQSVAGGGAIFWSLRRAETEDFDRERQNLGFKAAISVRHGAPLTIKLAAADRDWIGLDDDHYDEPYPFTLAGNAEAVTRFVTCARDPPRFSDDDVVGRETRLRVGFGERCSSFYGLLDGRSPRFIPDPPA